MTFPRTRMVVSGVLFVLWIGFLAYLVARTRNPIVLSRPQFLVADAVVVAELSEAKDAKIQRVLKPHGLSSTLAIEGLERVGVPHGWRGPGVYLLPLTRIDEGRYHVTYLPEVPGFFSYTLKLTSFGPEPAKVKERLERFTGWKKEVLSEKLAELPLEWKPLAAGDDVSAFVRELRDLKAEITLTPEPRIYQATEEVMHQLAQIQGSNP